MVKRSVVGIAKVEHPGSKLEIEKKLSNLLEQMEKRNLISMKPGSTVLVKPNICFVKGYETGATVDPFIAKCLIDWLLRKFSLKTVTIGEADATILNVDIAFKVLGWEDTFKRYPQVRLLNLTKDELVSLSLDGLYFQNLKMPKTYVESDYLISIGKLKTHVQTDITCILKNQFGAYPVKHKAKYHPYLDEVIHDVNKARLPDLCVVDGIIAMEGEGPVDGRPKPIGLLIVGNDAVATDHVCSRIMRVNPHKIKHLKLAAKRGLGSFDYDVFGEKIEDVRTTFVPFSAKLIRNKYIRRIPLLRKPITACYLLKRALENEQD